MGSQVENLNAEIEWKSTSKKYLSIFWEEDPSSNKKPWRVCVYGEFEDTQYDLNRMTEEKFRYRSEAESYVKSFRPLIDKYTLKVSSLDSVTSNNALMYELIRHNYKTVVMVRQNHFNDDWVVEEPDGCNQQYSKLKEVRHYLKNIRYRGYEVKMLHKESGFYIYGIDNKGVVTARELLEVLH